MVLQVTATSSTTATYQWLLNNVQIPGATSSTLLISNATTSNIGTYKCIVSNAGGSVTSTAAQLTFGVNDVPVNSSIFEFLLIRHS